MHDIKELENRWKRYKRKKRLPYIIGSFLVLSLIIVMLIYNREISSTLDKLTFYKTHTLQKSQSQVDDDERGGKLIGYLRQSTITTLAYQEKKLYEKSAVLSRSPLPQSLQPIGNVKKKKHLVIEVVDTDSKRRLHEIEKRFKLAHDPEDSLFLAKQYLRMKRYKKAEYWALQTNRINEKIEDSWLIFATAKASQGKRNEALKILGVYIEKTGSSRAKELYGRINSGKALNLSF